MRSFIFFLLVSLTGPAAAATLDILVAPGKQPPVAGTSLVFSTYYHNTGEHPVPVFLQQELDCRLISGGRVVEARARRIDPEGPQQAVVGIQGYVKVSYLLQLPDDMHGQVQLRIIQFKDAGLDLIVRKRQPEEEKPLSLMPQTTEEPLDSLLRLYQPYVKNISFYEPMYFLVGADPEYSKFQLSLKYRFFNPEKPIVQKHPWVKGFHFGYTQTSFWNLASDSAPFEDTSYKPELFYITDRLKTKALSLTGFFLQTGLRHESNGRGGEFSRSTNIAYIQPIFILYDEIRRVGMKITPRLWTFFRNEDENNPDLERYRGYFSLGITLGKAESIVVDAKLWLAAEGASVQVDATYPLHTLFFSDLDLYFQVQYTNRLAESLLNYTERTNAFRLGIAIVR